MPIESLAIPVAALRIFGGIDVPESHWIARVSGALLHDGKYACSGVIVDEHLFLTAAHCINRSVPMQIYFGTQPQKPTRLANPVTEWLEHPEADVALMAFEGELPEGYGYVPLLQNKDLLAPQSPVIQAGYGTNQTDDTRLLRKTESHIENPNYSPYEILVEQTHSTGVCYGDSGGPLFFMYESRPYLVGITSRGLDGTCNRGAIYSNLPVIFHGSPNFVGSNSSSTAFTDFDTSR